VCIVYILCVYCAYIVHILCVYCAHVVCILCTYCVYIVHILCVYCAQCGDAGRPKEKELGLQWMPRVKARVPQVQSPALEQK
jgi:hypothetical protein